MCISVICSQAKKMLNYQLLETCEFDLGMLLTVLIFKIQDKNPL